MLVFYMIAIYLITVVVSLVAFVFIITYFVYNLMIGMLQQEKNIRFERNNELFNKMVLVKMRYCFVPVINVIISPIRIVNCDKDVEKAQKYLLIGRKK